MVQIKSSNIAAIEFENGSDPKVGTLTVLFANGRTYSYSEVPATTYAKLLSEAGNPNGSVGKLFNKMVRSQSFEFTEVDGS